MTFWDILYKNSVEGLPDFAFGLRSKLDDLKTLALLLFIKSLLSRIFVPEADKSVST